jgi:hypothetical protein
LLCTLLQCTKCPLSISLPCKPLGRRVHRCHNRTSRPRSARPR